MATHITYARGNKEDMYGALLPQIEALIKGETDLIANLGNISAVLKEGFGHFWIGFYLVKDDELVLGPFQGPLACTRIKKGRGVCGTAWEKAMTQVVPDVELFPGHISCNSASRSEIVVPLIHHGLVWGVLDIDSDKVDAFDEVDKKYLEVLCNEIISANVYF